MALNRTITKTSGLLAALIGLALVGYITYLVLAQYRTQVAMQEAKVRQLTSDSAQSASGIGYFFAERKDDLKNLAQSRELSAYLENKALGMSMEYGLKASLIMIGDQLERMRVSNQLAGAPVYERIVFIDAAGELLAATGDARDAATPGNWKRYLTPRAETPSITVLRKHHGTGAVRPGRRRA